MPSWYIKATVQGMLSLLPDSHRWNYLFQRHITQGLRLRDAYFETKLRICARHLNNYQHKRQSMPARVVELGTGWLPIIPLGLALSGVKQVISVDINSHLNARLIRETMQHFVQYADSGELQAHLPDLQPEGVEALREILAQPGEFDAAAALAGLNIESIVSDARVLRLEAVDLIVSNNTLEHIPGEVIEGIFRHFRGLLGPGGMMSHLIDLSDHYAHFDRRLTPYHFLQFSPARWRIFNNRLAYQNRLRVSDYREIHSSSGFSILSEDSKPRETELIDQVQPAPEFSHYSREDLIVTNSWIVSEPIP